MTRGDTHSHDRDGLERVAVRYLNQLRAQDLAENTVTHHRGVLRRTTAWFGGPLLYRDRDQLETWQAARAGKVTGNTLHGEMCVLRSFYKWAALHDLIDTDPTLQLRMPRLRRGSPRPMSDAKWQRAIDQADDVMRVILGLAGWAGLRACEVAGLDWDDIDLIDRTMRVVGKGQVEDTQDFPIELAELLHVLPHRSGPVLPRRDGGSGPNAAHTISHYANGYLRSVGIRDTYHSLRHTFGTNVLEATGNLRVTQKAMRHRSVTSTAIYTAVKDAEVRAAVEGAAARLSRVRRRQDIA